MGGSAGVVAGGLGRRWRVGWRVQPGVRGLCRWLGPGVWVCRPAWWVRRVRQVRSGWGWWGGVRVIGAGRWGGCGRGCAGGAGAEADVAVITAGGALVSQQEGAEARRILREFLLDRAGRKAARMSITNWVGAGRPPGQGWRGGELEGVFPSWVALSALPTRSGKADPGPLAVAREALGRTVVGALWRSVEATEAAAGQWGRAGWGGGRGAGCRVGGCCGDGAAGGGCGGRAGSFGRR